MTDAISSFWLSLQFYGATAAVVYLPYLFIQLCRERSSFISWNSLKQICCYELILLLLSLALGVAVYQLREFPSSTQIMIVAAVLLVATHWWIVVHVHGVARNDLAALGLAPSVRKV